jgi:hypothetical protein
MMRASFGAAAAILLMLGAAQTEAQSPPLGIHLGVATCAGENCHGAEKPIPGMRIRQDEYLIWSKRDKHRQAYSVLLQDRAVRMARALGLPDAANQKLCLDCHTDPVPADQRGPQFQLSDGVGCEACHGGASGWLGIHISGASHRENIAAGMYPTEDPVMRAEKCLGCHFGDASRFVDHRLYGAGHPRLAFELDTYTAIEPAHFTVNAAYVARKGRITDLQVWAAGQAIALIRRMDALLDTRRAPRGVWPEFALFDCQSCHHDYGTGPRPTTTGLGPGTVKLNDANAVMLKVAATRVAPDAARALSEHMLALHKATQEDWSAVQREATAVRAAALALLPALAHHDYTGDDMRALAGALIALGVEDGQFSHDEQVTLALEAIAAGLKSSGDLSDQQTAALAGAMSAVYAAFPNEGSLRSDAFVKALKDLQRAIRQ